MTLSDKIGKKLDRLLDLIVGKPQHRWRPARVNDNPARYCDDCEIVEDMTPAEFYAQFGIPFMDDSPRGHS